MKFKSAVRQTGISTFSIVAVGIQPKAKMGWRIFVDRTSTLCKLGGIEVHMKTLLVAGVLAIGLLARAQPPAPNPATAHAPDGGTFTRIQSIAVLPLTGASFSATVTTEWTRILADGSTATVKNHRTVARDSTGRIFEERRSFAPDGDTQPTRIAALEYSDPNRHEFYSCNPDAKLAI
jgi:hypothetical protein